MDLTKFDVKKYRNEIQNLRSSNLHVSLGSGFWEFRMTWGVPQKGEQWRGAVHVQMGSNN